MLRTPGTTHRKSGRSVEAGALVGPYPGAAFEHLQRFAPAGGQVRSPVRRPKATQAGARSSILGQMWPDEKLDPAAIVRFCRQLAALAANPSGMPEPVHHAAAGVFARCTPDGRDHFKRLSRGYRGQSADYTDTWCEMAMDRNVAATTGPTTCARFEALNPGGCNGCPHRGKITSPIMLGRRHLPLIFSSKP